MTIARDNTRDVVFLIFGKLAESLIEIPAGQLVKNTKIAKNEIPPLISKIVGLKKIFQVVINVQSSTPNQLTFKVMKYFDDDDEKGDEKLLNAKGKNIADSDLEDKKSALIRMPIVRKCSSSAMKPIANDEGEKNLQSTTMLFVK